MHVDAGNKSVQQFLDDILVGLSVDYQEDKRSNKILIIDSPSRLCQSFRGTVMDIENKNPLPGAHIAIEHDDLMFFTTSDANGQFALRNIPVGRHDVKVSYVGFENKTIPNVVFSSAKEVFTDIALIEKPFDVEEVVIRFDYKKCDPRNEMTIVSARSFSVEETKRYPAAVNDPSRMALSFAGTMFDEDATNELIIRGNCPNGILWMLEGIEIPAPNHFAIMKSSSGAVSILSANLLDRSDFLTGAFPAEYGNALSGIFDISLRKGNNQKREYSFQVGILGTDLAIEGPFSKKYSGSYLVNYRYSTLDLLANQGAEAVILGCTEIGMLVNQNDTRVKLVDTTTIHAEKAVEYAI